MIFKLGTVKEKACKICILQAFSESFSTKIAKPITWPPHGVLHHSLLIPSR